MSKVTEILAVVFDFDDTLVPDSTTKLLKSYGFNLDKFWGVDARELIRQGYDQPFAYLKLMLENIGDGKRLGNLTNSKLREFGASLDSDFHVGLPEFFDDLVEQIKTKHS